MEIDTVKAAQSLGFYPPSDDSGRRTSLDSLSSPRLIVDRHIALHHRLYSLPPPPLPQRSTRRTLSVEPKPEREQDPDGMELSNKAAAQDETRSNLQSSMRNILDEPVLNHGTEGDPHVLAVPKLHSAGQEYGKKQESQNQNHTALVLT